MKDIGLPGTEDDGDGKEDTVTRGLLSLRLGGNQGCKSSFCRGIRNAPAIQEEDFYLEDKLGEVGFPVDLLVGLLNVDGYYDFFLSFIDQAVNEGFIAPAARLITVSAPTAKELVRKLEEYVPEKDEVTAKLVGRWNSSEV
ncbi:hypothetical protein MRB53_016385 [Persea americana]|uniref:Uncharacterized protein n=1 Tax=Persea americana TaxID=3435 RepID=A0ACC2M260_PERAE|nr:hypothetical protein MRB53_016385 [Persea americana]